MKLKKYKLQAGGELSAVDQVTPILNAFGEHTAGLMPIVTTTLDGVQATMQDAKKVRATEGLSGKLRVDTNKYMRDGGELTKFEGPSHEEGGIPIDENMRPNILVPIAEVEGEETGYQFEEGGYIFSDKLGTYGKSFADQSKAMDNKYKAEDRIGQKTKHLELKRIKNANDVVRKMSKMGENLIKRLGGIIGDPPVESDSTKVDNTSVVLKTLKNPIKFDKPKSKPVKNDAETVDDDTHTKAVKKIWELEDGGGVPQFDEHGNPVFDTGLFGMEINSPAINDGIIENLRSIPNGVPVGTNSVEGQFAGVDPNQLPVTMSDAPKNEPKKREPFNYNKIAVGLKGAAALKSGIDAFRNPEEEALQLNPNADESIQIAESLGINLASLNEQIDLDRNGAIQRARNISGNANVAAVLGQSAVEKSMRAKVSAKLQEQDANNKFRASEAQLKARLGSEERGERIRQQTVQSQNDAAARGFNRDFYGNLSKIGSEFNKLQVTNEAIANNKEIAQLTTAEGFKALSQRYPDFTIDQASYENWMKLVKEGKHAEADEFIRFRHKN